MKHLKLIFYTFCFFCCKGLFSQKQLLALSKGDHILAIIDPNTLEVKARVPVGDDPHEVIASTDGKLAYVSNSYGTNQYEIDVIDLVKNVRLKDINIKPLKASHGLDFSNGKLWFSAEGANAIGRYNPEEQAVDWSMGTGQERTHMIFVSKDAKKIYTTNVNSGTISIFEDSLVKPRFGPPPPQQNTSNNAPKMPPFAPKPKHQWFQTVVKVSEGVEGFDVSPDGKELWTVSANDGKIWIVDLITKQTKNSPSILVEGANRLKITPDGKRVLISSLRTGDLFIIDALSYNLIKKIKIGNGCAGILIDTDGKRAFIASTADNYITVLDLSDLEVVNKIQINGPDGLAWKQN